MFMYKKFLLIFSFFFIGIVYSFTFVNNIYADTLSSASDTLTTSRPSASTPLSADAASGVGNVSVYNNGSTFLASDSARLWGGTQENVTIATVSAAKTTLYFTGNTSNAHTNGTVISSAVTAMHKIQFTTVSSIPSGGSIVLTFPGSASTDTNQASPSASTFMFNNISASSFTNIKTNNATCTWAQAITAGSAFTLTCTTSGVISGGTVVTILIGCSSASGASCSTQVPTLINPTKSAGGGTSDIWALGITTKDVSSNQIDTTTVRIGTVESVYVVGHIDSTFTMTIAGVPDTTSINTSTYCGSSHAADASNTGFPSTSTDVNLGTLSSSNIHRTHQTITLASNSSSGYTLTATSSGHFINPANGVYLQDAQGTPTANDTPSPATITAGTPAFGIHACDANSKVSTSTWGQATAKFANPSASFYYTLVNSASEPASGGDKITIEYAATPASTTPAGDYRAVLTYVASVVF